jgi:hypothetical protein
MDHPASTYCGNCGCDDRQKETLKEEVRMRKPCKLILILILIFCFAVSFLVVLVGAEPSWVMWSRTYGGASRDRVFSIVKTTDGGFALAGDTFSFGAGSSDAWLVKTDELGNMEWNQTYGGADYDSGFSLVQTSDGGFAFAGAGWSYGAGEFDFWLVKTDGSGNMEWNQTYGGTSYDVVSSLVETSDGGFVLAGYTGSFGAGNSDVWLVKTDASGNMEWNRTYGGEKPDGAGSVIQTDDGGYAIAAYTGSFNDGNEDGWLIKTDSIGNMEWNQTFGGMGVQSFHSLIKTSDNGLAIVGASGPEFDNTDFWLVKTDGSGNMEWNRTYGGARIEGASSLVETSDGGYALSGGTTTFGFGNSDVWLVKTDASGNMEWNRTYGGEINDNVYSLIQMSDGGYALAGQTESFGAGDYDGWFIRTNVQGVPEFPSLSGLLLVLITSFFVFFLRKKPFLGCEKLSFFGLVTVLFGVQEIVYNIEDIQERLYIPLFIGAVMLFAGFAQILNYFKLRRKYSRLFEVQSQLKQS